MFPSYTPGQTGSGQPHITIGGHMETFVPLQFLVGVRLAVRGPEVLPCPISPQWGDLPRPPERRLRERLRRRTRFRSSPSSSSSAS